MRVCLSQSYVTQRRKTDVKMTERRCPREDRRTRNSKISSKGTSLSTRLLLRGHPTGRGRCCRRRHPSRQSVPRRDRASKRSARRSTPR
ncbi:unnamed protein product [Ectocarpus sp. 4 AP-2014]